MIQAPRSVGCVAGAAVDVGAALRRALERLPRLGQLPLGRAGRM